MPTSQAGRGVVSGMADEMARHRWIESEKAGRDLGSGAEAEWIKDHAATFADHCWFAHLIGAECWDEYGDRHFGLLKDHHTEHGDLVRFVVDQYGDRADESWVMGEAEQRGYPMEPIQAVYDALRSAEKYPLDLLIAKLYAAEPVAGEAVQPEAGPADEAGQI